MKQIILGTAGHIDHGKTSLVKALTGVDTDRLAEEKARGITIELGFASLDLPGGQRLGIVDVPGHEKFVKNMVAGASGIDIVALVVAADEGVMPQTREHLDICTLLDVRHGLVALTKTDMVDEDWLELVVEDIRESLQGTFLEKAPVVPVSSVTGQGLDDLRQTLAELCLKVPDRPSSGLFRLPVDRVFTMRGFGTVVTGTVASGRVAVGDAVVLYPSGLKSKVRGLQVHNQSVTEARAGMRAAVNFQGLEKDSVERGDVVAAPGTLANSYMVDVWLTLLPGLGKPLKNRVQVRFHAGTSEVMARVILPESGELAAGQSSVAQMRLDRPVALVRDDRFVLRSLSPVRTIGGGFVIDPLAAKHKKKRPEVAKILQRMTRADLDELVSLHVAARGFSGVRHFELLLMTNAARKKLDEVCGRLLSQKTLILADRETRTYLHADAARGLEARIHDILAAYHEAKPLKPGMPRQELKSRLGRMVTSKAFTAVMDNMISRGAVVLEKKNVRLPGHKVALAEDQARAESDIRRTYAEAGLRPPYFKEVHPALGIDREHAQDIMARLVEAGVLVRVKDGLFFDAAAVADLKGRLVAHLKEHGEIDTPGFKEMTGASRKYVIPLLEWFDANKVTLRVGDVRRLREA